MGIWRIELLNAARQIEADVAGSRPFRWTGTTTVDEAREKIARRRSREIGPDGRVIIFTDMFGGTPSNISLSFLEQGHVEIVTGVNLPMIVKFAMVQAGGEGRGHAGARDQRERAPKRSASPPTS